jgi:hypothetical protein
VDQDWDLGKLYNVHILIKYPPLAKLIYYDKSWLKYSVNLNHFLTAINISALTGPAFVKYLTSVADFDRYDVDANLIFGDGKKRPPRKKDTELLVRAFEGFRFFFHQIEGDYWNLPDICPL